MPVVPKATACAWRNRPGRCFRHAEVFHLALLNQLLHRSGYVFDRHLRVDAMLIE